MQAAASSAQKVYFACLSKGLLTKVSTSTHSCSIGTKVQWNAVGQMGPMGPTGAPGPSSVGTLVGSPCTIGGYPSTLGLSIDPLTGAVSLKCAPLWSLVVTNQQNGQSNTWGYITGTGLQPGSAVQVHANGTVVANGTVPSNGSFTQNGIIACGDSFVDLYVTSTTESAQPITSNTIANSPCG